MLIPFLLLPYSLYPRIHPILSVERWLTPLQRQSHPRRQS